MVERLTCQSCDARLKAPPSSASKRLKCPRCAALVIVPFPFVRPVPGNGGTKASGQRAGPGVASAADSASFEPSATVPQQRHLKIVLFGLPAVALVVAILTIVSFERSKARRQIETANTEVRELAKRAESWLAGTAVSDAHEIERALLAAQTTEHATDITPVVEALKRIRTRRAELAANVQLDNAVKSLNQGRTTEAARLLKMYIADPHATKRSDAETALTQVELVTSRGAAVATLARMSDDEFDQFRLTKAYRDIRITYPSLERIWSDTLTHALAEGEKERDNARQRKAKADAQKQNLRAVEVTSLIVKKVPAQGFLTSYQHRYFFRIRNTGSSPFDGTVKITLHGGSLSADNLGEGTFVREGGNLGPGLGAIVYVDTPMGPRPGGVSTFRFEVSSGGQTVQGSGQISNTFEDLTR
jgi:hypothetical protein